MSEPNEKGIVQDTNQAGLEVKAIALETNQAGLEVKAEAPKGKYKSLITI